MQGESNKAVIAAMLANFGIAVSKFVGFFFTGASSMLAEAVHSVADTGNQALLLWGSKRAGREPTALHPFGFGAERFFWSFVVALVLFTLGAMFAVYEGVHKIMHPEPLHQPAWALGILLVGVALESWSFHTAITEAKKIKGSRSWWSFIRNSRNPELPVVLLEDLGALAGLLFALLGVGLATLTGNPVFDAIATVMIGLLLAVIATVLAYEMKSLLIGEAAAPEIQDTLVKAIAGHTEVKRIIHLRTIHLGPEELLVAAKIEFSAGLNLAELARIIDEVELLMRRADPIDQVIYIEPDVFRLDRAPARHA